MIRAWVALLLCGHTTGGKTSVYPKPEDYVHCPTCAAGRLVSEIITDEPLTGPDGKR